MDLRKANCRSITDAPKKGRPGRRGEMPKATPESRSQERAAADSSSVNRLPMLILALLLAVGTALFAAWGLSIASLRRGTRISAGGAGDTHRHGAACRHCGR